MAEAHPVGFQWVMEAKRRGAKVFHVDPRFTRTSAVADSYLPIRAGTDIALLGGVVRYILDNELDFREYVLSYTNAATIVSEEFSDTEDGDGFFSGFDPETGTYVQDSWQYEGNEGSSGSGHTAKERDSASGLEHESHGAQVDGDTRAGRDVAAPALRLPDPQATLRPLHPGDGRAGLWHPAGQVPGVGPGVDGELRPGAHRMLIYSVGWTQHSVGVQYIRTGAIIQLLLGNMGRPGGGVMALRGHASIQGSTDIPTLFNLLPGYLPMPHHADHPTFDEWVDSIRHPGQKGFWGNAGSFAASLLKAYWGDAATPENDYCYGYLPRMTGDHGTYQQVLNMIDGKIKGYFLLGQNPAVGSAHGRAQRLGMANLDWLVVRDLFMIESATFWQNGPEVATGEIVPEECRTEVFFLPAASHVEKEGTFTQTQRLLQWREKAVEPPGDARSELWFFYHLGPQAAREAGRLDRCRATVRCSTSPGTTPRTVRTRSRAPRRCCARSTGTT